MIMNNDNLFIFEIKNVLKYIVFFLMSIYKSNENIQYLQGNIQ